ncbi:MAG TPA: cysteine desulfurase family protein [Thermoanaerobaculia bacterium]|nr:cysteine desulfurase family protein [Thermoanaerobaculia bacterium]
MNRIYFDNNATTPVHPDVLRIACDAMRDVFGNASSIHKEGQSARRLIEDAREPVARLLSATPREIVFTSGGSESNNAAIFGAVPRTGRHHIVTTAIEHPSVSEAVATLRTRGCDITVVPAKRNGVVDAARVIDAIRGDTRLVTMMLVNNETGVVQPVADVGRICRERGIHLHCDAVQGAGKIDINAGVLNADTLSLSAHKIHAPKGIGAMYVRRGIALEPLITGGAQERRRRAGTENVPLAAAFATAATLAADASVRPMIASMRNRFESALRQAFGIDVVFHGADTERVPNTSSVMFRGADAEGIAIALDLDGIAVSTGSACSSGRVEPSVVLLGMGLSPAEAKSTVRVSLSRFNTADEIERVVDVLVRVVPKCRR